MGKCGGKKSIYRRIEGAGVRWYGRYEREHYDNTSPQRLVERPARSRATGSLKASPFNHSAAVKH
jgi:hypothetical protein